jgi:N4-(beta-N-acetylglucosaminyl)-L-asparaginase
MSESPLSRPPLTRRRFLATGLATSAAAALPGTALTRRLLPGASPEALRAAAGTGAGGAPALRRSKTGPLVVASGNGLEAVRRAFQELTRGADPLDAAIAGVNLVEQDPKDYTVGYGGIPNADGVIQLDSSCMHGPTHRGGAVAALEGIKTPSKVARLVLERTDHVLLVGSGALEFAKLNGFGEEDLSTPFTRELYAYWKGAVSAKDDYLPPPLESLSPEVQDFIEKYGTEFFYPDAATPEVTRSRIHADVYGTINCDALDAKGNIGGVTTTSGLFFKIPGRVGDSPILGAGLYLDNDVGAAGSTGRGEANLLNCSSYLVVERMRSGLHPKDACLEACRRIAENTVEKRLQREDGRPNFNVSFYALDRTGRYGSGAIWSGAMFAVADERGARKEDAAALFERDA